MSLDIAGANPQSGLSKILSLSIKFKAISTLLAIVSGVSMVGCLQSTQPKAIFLS